MFHADRPTYSGTKQVHGHLRQKVMVADKACLQYLMPVKLLVFESTARVQRSVYARAEGFGLGREDFGHRHSLGSISHKLGIYNESSD
jgi:hypothetical protein